MCRSGYRLPDSTGVSAALEGPSVGNNDDLVLSKLLAQPQQSTTALTRWRPVAGDAAGLQLEGRHHRSVGELRDHSRLSELRTRLTGRMTETAVCSLTDHHYLLLIISS